MSMETSRRALGDIITRTEVAAIRSAFAAVDPIIRALAPDASPELAAVWSALYDALPEDDLRQRAEALGMPYSPRQPRPGPVDTDLVAALRGMLAEWDKFTRYGSPIAKASNEAVNFARAALADAEGRAP